MRLEERGVAPGPQQHRNTLLTGPTPRTRTSAEQTQLDEKLPTVTEWDTDPQIPVKLPVPGSWVLGSSG